jgi:hypothetical protein
VRIPACSRFFPALIQTNWQFPDGVNWTSHDFRWALENEFNETFSDVVFAIADWSPERRFLGPFREVIAPDEV